MPLLRQRRFPRARRSVGAAREFAVETLLEWGCHDRQDDIRLCVSELATNAVLHGVPPGREFLLALTVQAVADDFGVTPHNPGKSVWAVFKTDSMEKQQV
ncbi:hypothetical protein GT028_07275 [Streptomyces sp. SID2999]|uniref:ATP-binding protein n=1 Tax=Streptomyces sp. SID2999 TaxID=2690258 RepID=UPI0013722BE8|nr:ATP-binding protein [Streptomyces sp. SID2999]MYZ07174.1 hypothetical protein [Streptomyces sp. SID2999]